MMLIRIVNQENAPDFGDTQLHRSHSSKPPWLRVLTMENHTRVGIASCDTSPATYSPFSLCSGADLIINMWDCYDAPKPSYKALTSLITALKRLVTEKPAVLGVGSYLGGIGVQHELSSASSAAAYGLDMAGRVAGGGMVGSGGWRIESTRVS